MKGNSLLFCMIFLFAFLLKTAAQVTVYQEGFGPGASATNITDYQDWDCKSCIYTGSGRIGNGQTHICDLPESSGKGYAYFSSATINDLIIEQINISGFHDLYLTYNLKKAQVYDGKLSIEVWVDNKKIVSYNPTLPYTNAWFSFGPHKIPEGKDLKLRFSNAVADKAMYLDDLKISGVPDAPQVSEKPVFTPVSGYYTAPVELPLTAAEDARIYYTLDGTQPTETSLLYQAPITLNQTVTVSAIAISEAGSSEVSTAHYDIDPVTTVSDLSAFRGASERVRLDLSDAKVVDVDSEGIWVHTPDGGLLLPKDAVDAGIGDILTGFLVGKPAVQYGVVHVEEGVFRGLSVAAGTSAPTPRIATVHDVTLQPDGYTSCLLQFDEMKYHPELGEIASVEDGSETLRIKTGDWSLDENWIWPARMCVRGVLKGDEAGLYLWIAEASQVVDLEQQDLAEPVGTALVVTDAGAIYYAAHSSLKNNVLPCTQVAVLQGRAVASEEAIPDLLWKVDLDKGYLRNPSGEYLCPAESGVGLQFSSTVSTKGSRWTKDAKQGYWKSNNNTERALIRSNEQKDIRNYALSNVGQENYSEIPAVDMPLYKGYLRTLNPGHWGTVCVPYGIQSGDKAGALFFEIAGRLEDEYGVVRSVVLSGPVDRLEAGMPYVIYGESSQLALLYSGEPVAEAFSYNGLQGTFQGVNTDKVSDDATLQGKYVFSGNQLRRCAAGSSVGENKAYVDLEKVPLLSRQPEGSLRISLYQEETGVEQPIRDLYDDMPVFTVQGVYLGMWKQCHIHLPKGIYIVGKQKIIIK